MRIVFCGVGALGGAAVVLCRSLGADLRLADFDRVESKNLAAQAFVRASLGKNKAEALKAQLWNFWSVKAEALPVRVVADNVAQVCAGADLVVDAFDNRAGREVLSAHARAAALPLVHGALSGDGTFGLVRWDEDFTPDAEDHAGQATCEGGDHLPFIGLLAATLARAIQEFATKGVRRSAMVSLSAVTTMVR
jgi:molybdopterin/thiamine biosynthesis adenylyltransferase